MPGIITITDRADFTLDLNGATIDGHRMLSPFVIERCKRFTIRNANLCDSVGDVVRIRYCEDFRLEQLCCWNAGTPGNFNCIGIHESVRGQIVDCACWGTGRKTVCSSTNGDHLYWDRCWIRYDEPWNPDNDQHEGKPRMACAIAYNNRYGTWTDCLAGCTQASGDQGCFRGIYSVDRLDDGSDPDPHTGLYRCLAFSVLDVEAFDTVGVPIALEDCIDCTYQGAANTNDLAALRRRWATSPMLERIRELAGVDVMDCLGAVSAVALTPPLC